MIKGCGDLSNQSYYVSGNTSKGLLNYLPTNIKNINRIIVLKHSSEMVKTRLIKRAINHYDTTDDIEILKSPLGKNYLDGIIIRAKSVAIITDRIPLKPLSNSMELDLNPIIGRVQETDDYLKNKNKFDSFVTKAHQNFATGLQVHDDLEAIYIKEMNFKRADEMADNLIQEVLQNKQIKNEQAHVYHRFFGTNTADGVVNEVPDLIENIKHVYYIKGRAGTGKSTFMKKIVKACVAYGFDMELYHCSFDPNSLDMVLVRELDFCIFDSTDPHEFFPTRDGETIIDLYKETVTPGTDERFANQINSINSHYKSYMKKGIQDLSEAVKYLEKNEKAFSCNDKDIEMAYALLMKI
ncbi:hypothetical protein [Oceanobacillus rekensis]|uniref:hypothetical protein n=1 Tax=Oceanobacillus rekensis TaxID=937927 RepID=UPI000B42D38F|nr:hypothetical protein [Oceanobacillus rekensis]